MSNVGRAGRSFERITHEDLARLSHLAELDRREFFAGHPNWSLYAERHLATALCQGAALHFLRGDVGIQDFDVYSFYASHPDRRWYAKRNKAVDFGDPKFGQSPDRPDFRGRRVDLMGRAIKCGSPDAVVRCIQAWLASEATESASYLAKKAVVLLDPEPHCGTIVWPIDSTVQAA